MIGQFPRKRSSGWMSVNQLIFYHSVLLVYKAKQSKSPMYLHMMHNSWSYPYPTRQAETALIRVLNKPKLELARESFRWRGANCFNQLPEIIRTSNKVQTFKNQAKRWIMENVPL